MWAEAAKKRGRKRQLFETEQVSEQKTPSVAVGGTGSTPVTDENLQLPQQAPPPPAAVPFHLSSPAGSTGTAKFSDHLDDSETGSEAEA